MPYLLNIVYLLLIVVCSPWLAYAAIRQGKYRDGWGEKFLGRVPRRAGDRPCIWLHAVSVGEVNLLQPLLTELAQQQPTWECVISTTTRTGFALARKKYAGYQVFYCPLDFTWAVRQAMRRIRPDLFVLAELELWPNLIRAARRQGAKVAVVNGRLSEKSYRGYRRVRPLRAPDPEPHRLDRRAERTLRRTVSRPGRTPRDGSRDRLDQVRRSPDRSRQSRHLSGCAICGSVRRSTSCSWPAALRIPKRKWHSSVFATCCYQPTRRPTDPRAPSPRTV